MKKLLLFAAVAAIGCSSNVRQAPSTGLPEPRPAKQYQGDFEYPPPPSDEDMNVGKLEESRPHEFSVDVESWPGFWMPVEQEDNKLVYLDLETRCQLIMVFEFNHRSTAQEIAAEFRDNVFNEQFEKRSAIRLLADGQQAEFDLARETPSIIGRFVVRTYHQDSPGMVMNQLIICPGRVVNAPERFSQPIVNSVSTKPVH